MPFVKTPCVKVCMGPHTLGLLFVLSKSSCACISCSRKLGGPTALIESRSTQILRSFLNSYHIFKQIRSEDRHLCQVYHRGRQTRGIIVCFRTFYVLCCNMSTEYMSRLRSINNPLRLLVENEIFRLSVWANPTNDPKRGTDQTGMTFMEIVSSLPYFISTNKAYRILGRQLFAMCGLSIQLLRYTFQNASNSR